MNAQLSLRRQSRSDTTSRSTSRNSPEAFFGEIGRDLFLVGKEIPPSDSVQDRIDLLAVDRDGACVVIELKRSSHKLQMLQAVSYAAMLSRWRSADVLQHLSEERQEAVQEFLKVDVDQINCRQRILLIAEAFDLALLSSVE